MADGGVAVLVVMTGVHVPPVLAMPQLLGDMGMVVPVQLGVMAVAVGHGERPSMWPCLPEPHPGCRSSIPAVDRQVDRQVTFKLIKLPRNGAAD